MKDGFSLPRIFVSDEPKEYFYSGWTEQFRNHSLLFVESFQLFNIEFDEYQSESEFSVAAKEILRQLETFSLCEKRSDGVREVKIPPNSTDFPREIRFVVEKSDGTTLYISRWDERNFFSDFSSDLFFQRYRRSEISFGKFRRRSNFLRRPLIDENFRVLFDFFRFSGRFESNWTFSKSFGDVKSFEIRKNFELVKKRSREQMKNWIFRFFQGPRRFSHPFRPNDKFPNTKRKVRLAFRCSRRRQGKSKRRFKQISQ